MLVINCNASRIDNSIEVILLEVQYPPKPSAQTDLRRNINLSDRLCSVNIVPPKSIKCPEVCLSAVIIKSPNPVIKIIGINQMNTPVKK